MKSITNLSIDNQKRLFNIFRTIFLIAMILSMLGQLDTLNVSAFDGEIPTGLDGVSNTILGIFAEYGNWIIRFLTGLSAMLLGLSTSIKGFLAQGFLTIGMKNEVAKNLSGIVAAIVLFVLGALIPDVIRGLVGSVSGFFNPMDLNELQLK